MQRIKKGDTVQIIKGKERGKTGKVIGIDPFKNTVMLENLNMYKKHQKAKKQGEKGEVVSVPRPLTAANVLNYCDNCKKGTRVGFKLENGKKSRFCKKCKREI